MDLRFTIWFASIAAAVGTLSLLARVFRWKWVFNKVRDDRFWRPGHVWRYTISPFIIAGIGIVIWFRSGG